MAAGLAGLLFLIQAPAAPRAPRHHPTPKKTAPDLTQRLTNALDAAAAEKVSRTKGTWRTMSNTTSDDAPYTHLGQATITVSRDIEKTNSLTTPYLGYVTIDIQVPETDIFDTKAEADTAPFVRLYQPGKKLTYAYQDSRWVFKSEEKIDPK